MCCNFEPVRFRWNDDPEARRKIGLITVVPEVVTTPENPEEHFGMNYAELVPVLISAIQEQQTQIQELRDFVYGLTSLSERSP